MRARKNVMSIGEHFKWLHDNPPPPFNPEYDPLSDSRFKRVTESLVTDGWYANHTREECRTEWRRRYEALKAKDYPSK